MNITSTQRTPANQTASTAERQVYEALPQSQRRQRIAKSAYIKSKTQVLSRSWELDGWLQSGTRLDQQAAE